MEFGALVNLSFTYPRPLSRAGPVQCGSNPSSAPQPVRTLPTPDALQIPFIYPRDTLHIPGVVPPKPAPGTPWKPGSAGAATEGGLTVSPKRFA